MFYQILKYIPVLKMLYNHRDIVLPITYYTVEGFLIIVYGSLNKSIVFYKKLNRKRLLK